MTLTRMTEAHLKPLAALIDGSAFFQERGVSGESVAAQASQALGQDQLYAALDERGQLVGMSWVMPRGAFGRSAYLRLLVVREDLRGQGLGRSLMAQVERQALNPHGLCLLVTSTNMSARAFYEALGYAQVGLLPSYVKPGVDECLYYKAGAAGPRGA